MTRVTSSDVSNALSFSLYNHKLLAIFLSHPRHWVKDKRKERKREAEEEGERKKGGKKGEGRRERRKGEETKGRRVGGTFLTFTDHTILIFPFSAACFFGLFPAKKCFSPQLFVLPCCVQFLL